jgi:hypothetical protein
LYIYPIWYIFNILYMFSILYIYNILRVSALFDLFGKACGRRFCRYFACIRSVGPLWQDHGKHILSLFCVYPLCLTSLARPVGAYFVAILRVSALLGLLGKTCGGIFCRYF